MAAEVGKVPLDPAQTKRIHTLVQTNHAFIWRTLRRLGLTAEAADDAAQQVFLVASRRLDDIVVGAERTFLYRTAVRVACEARRGHERRASRTASEDVSEVVDPTPNPEELTSRKRARAMLDEVLAELDDDLREVFVLFELDGMSVPDIATLLATPQGTCASRLRRAREAFKEGLGRLRARHAFTGRSR
jgi:RNA polymerase sigma-70 factor (ECF subfamily)